MQRSFTGQYEPSVRCLWSLNIAVLLDIASLCPLVNFLCWSQMFCLYFTCDCVLMLFNRNLWLTCTLKFLMSLLSMIPATILKITCPVLLSLVIKVLVKQVCWKWLHRLAYFLGNNRVIIACHNWDSAAWCMCVLNVRKYAEKDCCCKLWGSLVCSHMMSGMSSKSSPLDARPC